MDSKYPATCVVEWVRENMSVTIEPTRLKIDDREDLRESIHRMAHAEATSILRVSIGEFLSEDIDLGEGAIARRDEGGDDYQGLADWMNGHFGTSLAGSDLMDLDRRDLLDTLDAAAAEAIERVDLGPLDAFLLEDYPKRELAQWVSTRFGVEFDVDRLLDAHDAEEATAAIIEAATALYREREICYPIDFAIDMTNATMQQDPAKALGQFCTWANSRYEVGWTTESLPSTDPQEIRRLLIEAARRWDAEKITERAGRILTEVGEDVDAVDGWLRENMNAAFTQSQRDDFAGDPRSVLARRIGDTMRVEVSQLEQWILLQILDASWKDHLHQMDQLRESIGYRSFSQRDPKIEFKREGATLFDEMLESIRDKVTDLVFKARLQARPRQAPQPQQPTETPKPPLPASEDTQQAQDRSAVAAAAAAASEGRRVRTGDAPSRPRKPSPAAAATAVVGRNEPCPCGSGKKYKKCCGSR
jgi:preprotein translocase subunit SecA